MTASFRDNCQPSSSSIYDDGDGDVNGDDDDVDDYTDGGGSGILGESWPGHQQGG